MNEERVAKFIAAGLAPSQVASIVGCSPARISQLLASDGFKSKLAAIQAAEANSEAPAAEREDELLSARYLATEHAILKQMEGQIPYAELRDCTNALRVISESREKRATRLLARKAMEQYRPGQLTVVAITMPQHAIPQITLNAQQEIIEIDKQEMAPLSSEAVRLLFATQKLKHTKELQTEANEVIDIQSDKAYNQVPADF